MREEGENEGGRSGGRCWLVGIYMYVGNVTNALTSVHPVVVLVPLAVAPRIVFRLNLQVCSSVVSFTACEQRMRMNSVMMSTMREDRRTMIALQSKSEMNISGRTKSGHN